MGYRRRQILVLAPVTPLPADNGLRVRISQALASLSMVYDVTVLSLAQGEPRPKPRRHVGADSEPPPLAQFETIERRPVSSVRRIIGSIIRLRTAQQVAYRSREFDKAIEKSVSANDFDYCLIMGGSLLLSYVGTIRKRADIRLGVDLCDDLYTAYRSLTSITDSGVRRAYLTLQRLLLWLSLRRDLRGVDDAIFISAKDADGMKEIDPGRRRIIPNSVPEELFRTHPTADRSSNVILFVGAMTSRENRDAVEYMVRDVFPLVEAECPGVLLRIVGSDAENVRHIAQTTSVEVSGYVSDLSVAYSSCAVFVCPLRAGSGVKNKVLEAMAAGCPVVATSVGVDGIECEPGRDLLVADEAGEFARHIVDLLATPDLREALGKHAREFASGRFSPGVSGRGWRELLSD